MSLRLYLSTVSLAVALSVSPVCINEVYAQKASKSLQAHRSALQSYKEAQFLLQDGWEEGKVDLNVVISKLRRSISHDPRFTPAYLLLGETYEQRKDFNSAIDIYREASRKSLDKEKGFINLGRVYAQTGKTGEARKVLGSIVKRDQTNVEALQILGSLERRQGKLDEAAKLLRMALGNVSGNNLKTFKELAIVEYQQKKYKSARLNLLKAMKIKEDDPGVHNLLGLLHLRENEKDKAAQAFLQAIEVDERYLPARLNLGSLFLEHGYFEKALEHFQIAEKLAPRDKELLNGIGVAYRGLNDFDKSKKYFDEALDEDSNYAPALYNLGLLHYRSLNDRPKAVEYFKQYKKASNVTSKEIDDYLARVSKAEARSDQLERLSESGSDSVENYQAAQEQRLETEQSLYGVDKQMFELAKKRTAIEKDISQLNNKIDTPRQQRFKTDQKITVLVEEQNKDRAAIEKIDQEIVASLEKLAGAVGRSQALMDQDRKHAKDQQKVYKQSGSEQQKIGKALASAGVDVAATLNRLSTERDQLAQIDRDQERLDKDLDKKAKSLLKDQDKLKKKQAEGAKMAASLKGTNAKFTSLSKDLFATEKKITAEYKKIDKLDDQRSQFDQKMTEIGQSFAELDQRRENYKKEFTDLRNDRSIEQALVELDRKRASSDVPLMTLEEQRKTYLERLNNHNQQMVFAKESLESTEERWLKVEGKLQETREAAKALEAQRAQIEQSIDRLLDQSNQQQLEVSKLLESSVKDGERLADFDKAFTDDLEGFNKSVDEYQKLVERYHDLHGKALSAEEAFLSTQSAFLVKAKKLPAEQFASLNGLKGQIDRLQSERGVLAKQLNQQVTLGSQQHKRLKVQADQRQKFQSALVKTDKERDGLIKVRSASVDNLKALKEQRQKVESSRDDIEKQANRLVDQRQKLLGQRTGQIAREMKSFQAVIDNEKKRQAALEADLLKSKSGKK